MRGLVSVKNRHSEDQKYENRAEIICRFCSLTKFLEYFLSSIKWLWNRLTERFILFILSQFHANFIALKLCWQILFEEILPYCEIYENATKKILFYNDCSIYVSSRPNFIFYNSCKIFDFALYFNNSTILL